MGLYLSQSQQLQFVYTFHGVSALQVYCCTCRYNVGRYLSVWALRPTGSEPVDHGVVRMTQSDSCITWQRHRSLCSSGTLPAEWPTIGELHVHQNETSNGIQKKHCLGGGAISRFSSPSPPPFTLHKNLNLPPASPRENLHKGERPVRTQETTVGVQHTHVHACTLHWTSLANLLNKPTVLSILITVRLSLPKHPPVFQCYMQKMGSLVKSSCVWRRDRSNCKCAVWVGSFWQSCERSTIWAYS